MRLSLIGLVLAVLLAGCGGPTVADRLDDVARSGGHYRHEQLPSPERVAALNPGHAAEEKPWHVEVRLRENEHARALLDAGPAVVPELVALLTDPERATLAAVFLTEIGGAEAASALLATWRRLRKPCVTKRILHVRDPGPPERWWAGGYRHEGVDGDLYGETLSGLALCGDPVSAEIAADTRTAMTESERLHAAGEPTRFTERDEKERRSWRAASVETATEGLHILAMLGADEGTSLVLRALRSPVPTIRYEAVGNASWLGDRATEIVPAITPLLDDPDLREEALDQLALMLHLPFAHADRTRDELEEQIEQTRTVLRERGHLPR